MKRENLLWLGGLLIFWAAWLFWLWRPERQLRLHQQHLLSAIENRHWAAADALLANDYSDRWGGSKSETLGKASEVFRNFLTVSLRGELLDLSLRDGEITERLRLSGNGGPLASLVIDRVNSLTAPFVFTWVHRSWKPWDYQLLRVEQPELQVPEGDGLSL